VSREKDIVNVISLKELDPKLEKHLRVKIYQGDRVLCADLRHGLRGPHLLRARVRRAVYHDYYLISLLSPVGLNLKIGALFF